jgi:hypothetical protein
VDSPYRTLPEEPAEPLPPPARTDADIVGLYAVIWVITLVKVALSAAEGETFGAGLTLLCLLLVALPALAKEGIADLLRRRPPR